MRKSLDPTRKPMRTPSIPSKEVLTALMEETQNVAEICRRLNYSVKSNWVIYKYMEMYGIPKPGDRFDRLRSAVSLTQRQRELIVGMLLGDASIPALRRRDKNHCLTFAHTPKQLEYAIWKAEQLAPLNRPLNCVAVRRKADEPKKYTAHVFNSIRHQDFADFRRLFYPEGKKIVPTNIADILTVEGAAIWYMDDGSLNRWHTKLGAYCEFATCSFDETEHGLLADALNRLFGVTPRILYSAKMGGTGYRLFLDKPDSFRFAERVRPHFHPAMLYKLP